MSWIAKNSLTGKTYGPSFDSIYDCQGFIDSHLKLLEYEFQRAFALEEKFLLDIEIKNESSGNIIGDMCLYFTHALHDFENSFDVNVMKKEFEKCFLDKKAQRKLDNELISLAKTNWLKNNIIRCWYVEQERFADGFDF